jgi:hypothetical protein
MMLVVESSPRACSVSSMRPISESTAFSATTVNGEPMPFT